MTFDDFGKTLSNADVPVLQELVAWWRAQRRNSATRTVPSALTAAPTAYLARASEDIPAMTIEAGTGTDSSVGVISKADCRLFRIDDWGTGIDVDPMGEVRPVYNPSVVAVTEGTLFLAVRTQDGKFVAVQLGGGSGDEVSFSQPALDGASPPKPKLESHAEVDYDLDSDTVVLTGRKFWARNMNL